LNALRKLIMSMGNNGPIPLASIFLTDQEVAEKQQRVRAVSLPGFWGGVSRFTMVMR
jgi:hypothetical protein